MRERTLKIDIEYTGIADNINFEQPLPSEFRFTVRDQGKRLQKYQTFVPIEIDLKPQLAGKEGKIHVSADQVKSKIADQLQGTAKIQNIRPELIEADYFVQAKKVVPVKIRGSIIPAQQYYFTQEPIAIPQNITIYGKEEAIDTISFVYTEPFTLCDVRDSITFDVNLLLATGIRYSANEIKVMAETAQFTEKTMILDIVPIGVPQGEQLRLFPSATEVTLRIALSNFNEVNETDINVFCQYPQHESRTLPVELEYNTNNIIQARFTPSEVEYIIEKL